MKARTVTAWLSWVLLLGSISLPAAAADSQQLHQEAQEKTVISGKLPSAVSGGYSIQVNGEKLDVQAKIMVPLRAVAEAMGFSVTWNDGAVLVDNGTIHTTVTIGVDRYVIATSLPQMVGMSAPFSLGAAPYVTEGVTYVPLGLFPALLGSRADSVRLEGEQIVIQTENQQLANPFLPCETMDEAKKAAKFDLECPDRLPGWVEDIRIRAMEETMIEVVYTGKGEELRLRKAVGSGDVSGEYTPFEEVNTVAVENRQVTMKGRDGKVMVANWTDGGYTYAIHTLTGMEQDDLSALIRTVK